MARPGSKDCLDKFRWLVDIPGFARLGFTSVEVPSMDITTTEYREGGRHLFPRQILGSVSYKPIALIRGISVITSKTASPDDFRDWVMDAMVKSLQTDPQDPNLVYSYRRNVIIRHLDRYGREIKTYTLYDAIPVEYKPASDFAADADDTFSLEKLVLKYEGFIVETPGDKLPLLGSVGDLFNRLTKKIF